MKENRLNWLSWIPFFGCIQYFILFFWAHWCTQNKVVQYHLCNSSSMYNWTAKWTSRPVEGFFLFYNCRVVIWSAFAVLHFEFLACDLKISLWVNMKGTHFWIQCSENILHILNSVKTVWHAKWPQSFFIALMWTDQCQSLYSVTVKYYSLLYSLLLK